MVTSKQKNLSRIVFLILLIAAAYPLRVQAQLHPGRNDVEFDHGGRHRTAVVLIPKSVQQPAEGWPLVMMLHGAGGSARNVIESTGWPELGERVGIVTVYPNGTPKNEKRPESFFGNQQTWNSGGKESLAAGALSATAKEIDDVGFLGELIARVRKEVPVDPKRIFVAGHSNGAGMAYRFAFERSDLVAAAGVVAGHFFLEPSPLSNPVSLIQIVGDKDPFTPMAGGKVTILGRTATLPPALQSPREWATMIGIEGDAKTIREDDSVQILSWGPSASGAEVRSVVIKGHGHAYPSPTDRFHPAVLFGPTVKTLNATETMWKFFSEHARKEP
ncbi:MAG TPA: PHB depolymerase family esterase [Bacteroidota bacterium]|nr:PHB depolymerase family esterase [Bacteroidota bacterium]